MSLVQGKGNNSKLFKRTVSENIRRAASVTEKGDGPAPDVVLYVALLHAAMEFDVNPRSRISSPPARPRACILKKFCVRPHQV